MLRLEQQLNKLVLASSSLFGGGKSKREQVMKNTRSEDLDILDYARELMVTDKEKRAMNTNLAIAHFMSKDATLEKARIQLIDALKRGDIKLINKLEKDVKRYANTQTFRKNLAQHVNKNIGNTEADIIFSKRSI